MSGKGSSLKCGRLGTSGRALGIVAQELRGCSHRTEEAAHAISAATGTAVHAANRLVEAVDTGHAGTTDLLRIIEKSLASLRTVGEVFESSLAGLQADCSQVAEMLDETARSIVMHQKIADASAHLSRRLITLADSVVIEPSLDESIQGDVRRLLETHYTMESERTVHRLFAEDEPNEKPHDGNNEIVFF